MADCVDVFVIQVIPSAIVVVVQHNIVCVAISKKIVPISRSQMTAVMEHKLQMRSLLAHNVSHISVENLQRPLVGGVLRLVDRFKSVDCWVVAPLVTQTTHCVLCP